MAWLEVCHRELTSKVLDAHICISAEDWPSWLWFENLVSLSTYVCLVTIVLTSDQCWYLRVECPAVASPPILGTSKPGQDAATWHLQTELANFTRLFTILLDSFLLSNVQTVDPLLLMVGPSLCSVVYLLSRVPLCCTTLCPWWACLLNLPFAPICSSIFF